MKNFWLRQYEQRKKRVWTIEFYKYVTHTALHARKVILIDPEYTFQMLGQSLGKVAVVFVGAMYQIQDRELMDFLTDAHASNLYNYTSRIRVYLGLGNEIENFELSGLTYSSMQNGFGPDDIKLVFNFRHCRRFQPN